MDKLKDALEDLVEVYTWPTREKDREEEIRSEISGIHHKLAIDLYSNHQNFQEAMESFQLALNFSQPSSSVLIFQDRAKCFSAFHHDVQAIQDLLYSLKIGSEDSHKVSKTLLSDILTRQGIHELERSHYTEAMDKFTESLLYSPSDPVELYFERARCRFYLNQLDLMKGDLEKCLELSPKHPHAQAMLSLFASGPLPVDFRPFPARPKLTEHVNVVDDTTTNQREDTAQEDTDEKILQSHSVSLQKRPNH